MIFLKYTHVCPSRYAHDRQKQESGKFKNKTAGIYTPNKTAVFVSLAFLKFGKNSIFPSPFNTSFAVSRQKLAHPQPFNPFLYDKHRLLKSSEWIQYILYWSPGFKTEVKVSSFMVSISLLTSSNVLLKYSIYY